MKGSIHKHVAKDGTVSWRIRVDYYDPQTGRRHQPQRTFPTKRDAEAALARWLIEVEPDRAGEARMPRRWQRPRCATPLGPVACMREIARLASDLQWLRHELSRTQVTAQLRYIEEYAQAALDALTPEEAAPSFTPSPSAPDDGGSASVYHVYRLLADGVPFYVGQSHDVPARVRSHISAATSHRGGRSARTQRIREALAAGQTISYDIVDSAQDQREIRRLERLWILDLLAQGYTLANGAAL